MKKLICTSCGAPLKIEENKEYAVCNHCGSKYKLNEDLNISIKLDDNMKEVLQSSLSTFNKSKIFFIIPFIICIIIFGLIIYFGFINNNINKNTIKNNQNEYDNNQNEFYKQHEKESFNFQFFEANGTKSAFFLKNTLDSIIQSNKVYDKKITLVFNGEEISSEAEIIEIKHSLDGNYEVSFNYDEEGYINKIIVDIVK